MSNSLVKVPSWNQSNIRYIIKVQMMVNGVCRRCSHIPPRPSSWFLPKEERASFSGFFSQFVYESAYIDPLKEIKEIMYQHSNLARYKKDEFYNLCSLKEILEENNWGRFIQQKQVTFRPAYIPFNIDDLYFIVDYIEVKNSIAAYLFQKYNPSKEVMGPINKLFENVNKKEMDYRDFIDSEAKRLSTLNLDRYVESLNEQTQQKAIKLMEERKCQMQE